jgi:hypothetical protein
MVYQGGLVPAGVGQETLDRLVAKGLIEAVSVETGYDALTVADLKAEIEKRNEGRDDDTKVSADGKKVDLVAALVADDAKQAE